MSLISPYPANYRVVVDRASTSQPTAYRFPAGFPQAESLLAVRVTPDNAPAWEGVFDSSYGEPAVTVVTTHPDPNLLCVVADGAGFLIDVRSPTEYREMDPYPIVEVLPAARPQALVLISFSDVAVYGHAGRLWKKRVSWDGFRNCRIAEGQLVGECLHVPTESWVAFEADLQTGRVVGGCRLPKRLPGEPE